MEKLIAVLATVTLAFAAPIAFAEGEQPNVYEPSPALSASEPEFTAPQEPEEEPEPAEPVAEPAAEEPVLVAEESFDEAVGAADYVEPEDDGVGYRSNAGNLRYNGVEYDGNTRYTWYSQNVLPGGALNIPGRHVGEDGYVMDGDGNICVASSDLPYGTHVDTPYGPAVVYDSGCASGTIDVYTNW